MSDDQELPVARQEVEDAISEVIDEKGIDSLSPASIRAFLTERFGQDFTAHKKTIDEMTIKKIEKIQKKQESDAEKEKKVKEKKEKRKKDEPVEEKTKEKRKKASKAKEESLDEPIAEVMEKVKKEKHKKASKVVEESDELVEEVKEKHKKASKVKDETTDSPIDESVAVLMKQDPIDEPMEEMKLELPSTVREELDEVEKELAQGKASKTKEELADLADELIEKTPIVRKSGDEVSSSSSDSTSSSGASTSSSDSSDSETVDQPSQVKAERGSSSDSITDRTPRKSKRSGDKKKARAAGTSSFSKIMAVSDSVKEVTGQQYMRRCDVVKSVWTYIKENNLRDPKDKNYAICDAKLRKIFEMDSFKPFSMMKHLQKHIFKPEDLGEEHVRNAAQAKKQLLAQLGEEDVPKLRPSPKRRSSPKRTSSGKTTDEPKKKRAKPFQKVLVCSDALAEVTGKQFMTRSDAVKALWDYIRTNNLQDPKNKQFVKSDANFEKIFRSKRFKAFGMMSKLGKNLLPPEEYGPEWVKMAEEARKEQEEEQEMSKNEQEDEQEKQENEDLDREGEVGPSKSNETEDADELPDKLSQSDSD
ncbi:unnamed protein product, partial [Mesorhabditis belari]|uniref:Uncharacterized protein n=1 Tax=Mesorhabditis belari TaxID=2138241 RepID=A0AAF3EHV5_9BILA